MINNNPKERAVASCICIFIVEGELGPGYLWDFVPDPLPDRFRFILAHVRSLEREGRGRVVLSEVAIHRVDLKLVLVLEEPGLDFIHR